MKNITAPLLVVGCGLNGLIQALALVSKGFQIGLVDAEMPDTKLLKQGKTLASRDGRTTALAARSEIFLREIGAWEFLDKAACPITDIRVVDQYSRHFLHFDKAAHDETKHMGSIIDNNDLKNGLWRAFLPYEKQITFCKARIEKIEQTPSHIALHADEGRVFYAKLCLAADGKFSKLRQMAGIDILSWRYGQTAVTATVKLEKPHYNYAHEWFFKGGPFAILPMNDDHACFVWSDEDQTAQDLAAMKDELFEEVLAERCQHLWGEMRLVTRRFCYPLSLSQATKMTAPRLALIGDAAHAMHPIAGQGLNMGIRDSAAMIDLISHARHHGLDEGNDLLLQRYEAARALDNVMMLAATDGLTHLFANDWPLVKQARQWGLSLTEKLPGMKSFFMKQAMGQSSFSFQKSFADFAL